MADKDKNDDDRNKGAGKKKAKETPKKERQISLRLTPKGARRLSRLTEKTEWTVTQVIEEALKFYAAHEGISAEDAVDGVETSTTAPVATNIQQVEIPVPTVAESKPVQPAETRPEKIQAKEIQAKVDNGIAPNVVAQVEVPQTPVSDETVTASEQEPVDDVKIVEETARGRSRAGTKSGSRTSTGKGVRAVARDGNGNKDKTKINR